MRLVSDSGIRRPPQQCLPMTTPKQFLKPTTESSGTDPSVLSDRNRRQKTIVSLTSHVAMVRIGHALLIVLRMGGGRSFDLRPDDARLVSVTRERRAACRAADCDRDREAPDDQAPPPALQSLHTFVPAFQAQAVTQSAGLAVRNLAPSTTGEFAPCSPPTTAQRSAARDSAPGRSPAHARRKTSH